MYTNSKSYDLLTLNLARLFVNMVGGVSRLPYMKLDEEASSSLRDPKYYEVW